MASNVKKGIIAGATLLGLAALAALAIATNGGQPAAADQVAGDPSAQTEAGETPAQGEAPEAVSPSTDSSTDESGEEDHSEGDDDDD